ncbi:MAG: hypothetical protein KIT84_24155 [Labilithrix sp.]|nr:hypothetical protein [Labilithrix sp.]MCW5814143.1 hypothetical protein [Labilithrix sp.]
MSHVRARTLARLKLLAGAGVAAAGCHDSGYGVVDPMPPPSYYARPQPTVTASFVKRAESEASGIRFLEVALSYAEGDVTVSECAASDSTGQRLEVVERAATTNGLRCVLKATKDLTEVVTHWSTNQHVVVLVLTVAGEDVTVQVR